MSEQEANVVDEVDGEVDIESYVVTKTSGEKVRVWTDEDYDTVLQRWGSLIGGKAKDAGVPKVMRFPKGKAIMTQWMTLGEALARKANAGDIGAGFELERMKKDEAKELVREVEVELPVHGIRVDMIENISSEYEIVDVGEDVDKGEVKVAVVAAADHLKADQPKAAEPVAELPAGLIPQD